MTSSSAALATRTWCQAPIDPRIDGANNFPTLIAATGLFEIIKADSGQTCVTAKRDRDCAPTNGLSIASTVRPR